MIVAPILAAGATIAGVTDVPPLAAPISSSIPPSMSCVSLLPAQFEGPASPVAGGRTSSNSNIPSRSSGPSTSISPPSGTKLGRCPTTHASAAYLLVDVPFPESTPAIHNPFRSLA
ncbi:hypothetical protein CTheo_8765 [Ceratobasidium theobromae]|uniref:Uncharacterized protein n=1 Tax=Ceratobasidium theobromae TaxID=1582974 RepID=A0A5N5Q8G8_9AGAM|nr:hypothetical protein CTheo_8765 [Ceratobasidium theobromae]